jgi:hypothetical protein
MDPYFTAINRPVPQDTMMVMLLSDFQSARTGRNFFTGMGMVQYGLTSRWTVGFMSEGQKIFGLPTTYGGLRVDSYLRVFPHDHVLNFTVYGEYEGLNEAGLYKMEVSGFGGEDLSGPLAEARRTPARTFEQRAIVYHDWGRTNLTFNFINETGLDTVNNNFGYAWGVFRQPAWMAMDTGEAMAGGRTGAIGVLVAAVGLWAGDDRGIRQHRSVWLRLAAPAAVCGSSLQLRRITALERSGGTSNWTLCRERSVCAADGAGVFDRSPPTSIGKIRQLSGSS